MNVLASVLVFFVVCTYYGCRVEKTLDNIQRYNAVDACDVRNGVGIASHSSRVAEATASIVEGPVYMNRLLADDFGVKPVATS